VQLTGDVESKLVEHDKRDADNQGERGERKQGSHDPPLDISMMMGSRAHPVLRLCWLLRIDFVVRVLVSRLAITLGRILQLVLAARYDTQVAECVEDAKGQVLEREATEHILDEGLGELGANLSRDLLLLLGERVLTIVLVVMLMVVLVLVVMVVMMVRHGLWSSWAVLRGNVHAVQQCSGEYDRKRGAVAMNRRSCPG